MWGNSSPSRVPDARRRGEASDARGRRGEREEGEVSEEAAHATSGRERTSRPSRGRSRASASALVEEQREIADSDFSLQCVTSCNMVI